jgi:hypothetical protein
MQQFTRAMGAGVAFVVVAFLGSLALAGVVVTEAPGLHELRERDGTILQKYDTRDACLMAARLAFETRQVPTVQFRCVQAVLVTVVGDCADVPKPAAVTDVVFDAAAVRYAFAEEPQPGVEIRPDGVAYTFTQVGGLEPRLCPGSDTRYFSATRELVRQDSSKFPHCWAEQLVPEPGACAPLPDPEPAYVMPVPPDTVTP